MKVMQFVNPTLNSRVKEASAVLKSYLKLEDCESFISNILINMGIDDTDLGLKILNSSSTTAADFNEQIKAVGHTLPEARIRVALAILKGENPFEEKEVKMAHQDTSILEAVKAMKPIGQWSDTELLEQYGKACSLQVEEELFFILNKTLQNLYI